MLQPDVGTCLMLSIHGIPLFLKSFVGRAGSRHVYFTLGDTGASLAATIQIAPSYMFRDTHVAADVPRVLRKSISDFKVALNI